MKPTIKGKAIARAPGIIISRSAAAVEISTARGRVRPHPLVALEQSGDLSELATHFLDHAVGRPAHCLNRERGEEEREHSAEEQANGHVDVEDVERLDLLDNPSVSGFSGGLEDCLTEGEKQGESGHRRRGDGKPLGHRGGRVAQRV